jgi:hypothetical protein
MCDLIYFLERVMGIEPTLAAWEAAVLPLNYTRIRAFHSKPVYKGQAMTLHQADIKLFMATKIQED